MTRSYSTGQTMSSTRLAATPAFYAQALPSNQPRRRLNPLVWAEIHTARQTLEEIALLEEDWDGYGAARISKPTRINAWEALRHFEAVAIPEITPLTNGTIAFDWQSNGARGHCEIGRTRFSMYVTSSDGTTRYFSGSALNIANDARDALNSALSQPTGDEASFVQSLTSIHFASASAY